MRRWIVGLSLSLVVAIGCSRVYVPNTPEGQRCVRECMMVYNSCAVGCYGEQAGWCRIGCQGQQKNCHRTCPGATEE